MRASVVSSVSCLAFIASAIVGLSGVGMARESQAGGRSSVTSTSALPPTILEAEAQGLVTVRYIPNDSRSAQIIVTNRTRRPATLRWPAAFAGVPVLAQMGMGMMGGGQQGAGFGAGGIGAAPQTSGGGGAGGQGMNGMGGGGGGAFSIPPEKTRVFRVTTVCLEHGRPEPNSRYPYKLSPLESFSTDPKLAVVLESLGRGELSQKVAQAAAWHIANGMTWEQLAAEKIDHAGGVPDEPYFAPAELVAAHRVVAAATRLAAARTPAETSPGSAD